MPIFPIAQILPPSLAFRYIAATNLCVVSPRRCIPGCIRPSCLTKIRHLFNFAWRLSHFVEGRRNKAAAPSGLVTLRGPMESCGGFSAATRGLALQKSASAV
jgi:hypothetical protein